MWASIGKTAVVDSNGACKVAIVETSVAGSTKRLRVEEVGTAGALLITGLSSNKKLPLVVDSIRGL